jgi:predicted DNA-binding transcriptional regulator AlpA
MNIADRDAIGIYDFCDRHGISRSSWYNLVRDGIAPRVMRVGARVLISKEAVTDWRREREKAPAKEIHCGGDRGGRRPARQSTEARNERV